MAAEIAAIPGDAQSDGEQGLRTAGGKPAGREAIAANVQDDDRSERRKCKSGDQSAVAQEPGQPLMYFERGGACGLGLSE